MKYFKSATLDELKAEYRALAMLHHPDRGGDTATMQEINNEYDLLFPLLKLAYNLQNSERPTHETADTTRSEFYTQNGWQGENYRDGRSLKEIAQLVRAYVKQNYPTYKFSVRTAYASMCQELHVEMKESPAPIYKSFDELTEDDKHALIRKMQHNFLFTLDSWYDDDLRAEFERIWSEHGDFYRCMNDQTAAVAGDVDDFVRSYNREDCDGMIDYFDVNFYYFGCCQNNGTGVKVVPKTARIKAAPEPEQKAEQQPAESVGVLRVEINSEFNGVEVYFPGKPAEPVRAALKSAGFRWRSRKCCWYNKNTEENLQTLRRIETGLTA